MCRLTQLHIDVARNATDDFNPFHDPRRWKNIRHNPFGGPIALGFQLVALAMDRVTQHREASREPHGLQADGPDFTVLRFSFTGAVQARTALQVQVRKTRDRLAEAGEISNRILIRDERANAVLLGSQKDCTKVAGLAEKRPLLDRPLTEIEDRTLVGNGFFLKRKYLMTSNAKNFCTASLVPQHRYIDELADKVCFPPSFPLALTSCALLERARSEDHDFERQPFIYTEQRFVIDNRRSRRLQSNQPIHFLAGPQRTVHTTGGLRGAQAARVTQHCIAMLDNGETLFEGALTLAPLEAVIGKKDDRDAI